VGDFLIWLSGVSRQLLGQCTTERPKFIGLGAAILVTAGMAAVSLSFALVSALKAPVWLAVFFALLWGLAIMSLDRLFVVSMHRQRNRFYYLIMATPRFLMAVLLGFVISTPFVLQIFKPEIDHQIKLMQAAERSAYFKNLPHNPVYLAVQKDKATVSTLAEEAATGGAAINPSMDPTIEGWRTQLASAQANEQTWFANLQCQLYGTALPGGRKCIQGNGPLAKDDQQQYEYWKGQVSTLQQEIQQRTDTLRGQSAAKQKADQGQAQSQLAAAKLALSSAQQQLTMQTNDVTSGIKQDSGLLTQLKALGNATAGDSTLARARFLLFLVFLVIDIMPVFVKLLLNLAPESTYDEILAAEEKRQKMSAEHTRAVRLAAERKSAQAEISGARDRLAALSTELPGMRDDIMAARMRVEREWLQRWEADQMRRVANGQGITPADTGVGPMPSPDSWQRYQTGGGFRPWPPPRNGGTAQDRRARPPRRPGPRRPRQDPPRRPPAGEPLWGLLGSLRLPRLPRLSLGWLRMGRRGRQEPRLQAGPEWRPRPANRPGTGPGAGTGPQFQGAPQLYADTQPGPYGNEGNGANGNGRGGA
jgi:hypothetical protein